MANTTNIPSPDQGNLQIQRILDGHCADEIGEEAANFSHGPDLAMNMDVPDPDDA